MCPEHPMDQSRLFSSILSKWGGGVSSENFQYEYVHPAELHFELLHLHLDLDLDFYFLFF